MHYSLPGKPICSKLLTNNNNYNVNCYTREQGILLNPPQKHTQANMWNCKKISKHYVHYVHYLLPTFVDIFDEYRVYSIERRKWM